MAPAQDLTAAKLRNCLMPLIWCIVQLCPHVGQWLWLDSYGGSFDLDHLKWLRVSVIIRLKNSDVRKMYG